MGIRKLLSLLVLVTTISVTAVAVPSNDDCKDNQVISCGETIEGKTTAATFEQEDIECTSPSAPGVWYAFQGDGLIHSIHFSQSDFILTDVTVLTGHCYELSCVVTDDIYIDNEFDRVYWLAETGKDYYILIASNHRNKTGSFTFTIDCTEPPANDLCSDAIDLPIEQPIMGNADFSITENQNSCNFNSPGIWYTFVGNGLKNKIEAKGAKNPVMSVYSGTCTNLDCVASGNSEMDIETVAGETYYVYVHTFFNQENYDFNITRKLANELSIFGIEETTYCSQKGIVRIRASQAPIPGISSGTFSISPDIGLNVFSNGTATIDFDLLPEDTYILTYVLDFGTQQITSQVVFDIIDDSDPPTCDPFDITLNLDFAGNADFLSIDNNMAGLKRRFDAHHQSVTSLISNIGDFTGGTSGTFIADGGNDMFDEGNIISTDIGGPVPYTGGTILSDPAFNNGSYFTRKREGIFYMAANLNGATEFFITGNTGADGEGFSKESTVTASACGTYYTAYIKKIYGSGDPSINHMVIVPSTLDISQSSHTHTDSDYHVVRGFQGNETVHYLMFSSADGEEIYDYAMEQLLESFILNILCNAQIGVNYTDDCFVQEIQFSQSQFTCLDAYQTIAIDYTIIDANGLESTCTGNVFVDDPSNSCFKLIISDPCSCNDDQSANGAMDGTFSETVTISPSMPNFIWTVSSIIPLDPTGPAPIGIAVGDLLTYDPDSMEHFIQFDHVDLSGYEIEVEGPFDIGDPRNITSSAKNLCKYPIINEPTFDVITNLCTSGPIRLQELNEEINGDPGEFQITVDGELVDVIDPSNINAGSYVITWKFIADFVDNTYGSVDHPAYPGCTTEYSTVLTIEEKTLNISCNDNIQISLNSDCRGVTPNILLEGTLAGEYTIELEDGQIGTARSTNSDFEGVDWSLYLDYEEPVSFVVRDPCRNACWGSLVVQVAIVPEIDSDCEYVPAENYELSGGITFENPDFYEFSIIDACQEVTINISEGIGYECGTEEEPMLCPTNYEIQIAYGNNIVLFSQSNLSGEVTLNPNLGVGDYTITLSTQDARSDGRYTINIGLSDCGTPCKSWCGAGPPEDWVSLDSLESYFTERCIQYPINGFLTTEDPSGDICGGLVVTTHYGYFEVHGEIEKIDLLKQAYTLDPFNLARIQFPGDLVLNCHSEYTPEDILAKTGKVEDAYPYLLDLHKTVRDSICSLESTVHEEVAIDTVEHMTLVDGEWILVPHIITEKIETTTCVRWIYFESHPNIPIDGKYCNILSTYSDEEFYSCGTNRKILRTWGSLDWCTGEQFHDVSQTIEIRDDEPPVLLKKTDDIIGSMEPWYCGGIVALPLPKLYDNCGQNAVRVEYYPSEGRIDNGYLTDIWLETQPVEVVAHLSDECGNVTKDTFMVKIYDLIEPQVVCKETLTVTLLNGDYTKVYAHSFDDGSHDTGCGPIEIKARRLDGCCDSECTTETRCIATHPITGACLETEEVVIDDYGFDVQFCCADAGDTIRVEIIAIDQAGNTNTCFVPVIVQNPDYANCSIESVTIDCDADIHDMTVMGWPSLNGICDSPPLLYNDVKIESNCYNATIQRNWYFDIDENGSIDSTDQAGCAQTIYVENNNVFDPYTIKWPKHYTGEIQLGTNLECENHVVQEVKKNIPMGDPLRCVPDVDSQEPVWCESHCGLLALTVETDTLYTDDSCLKIIRSYNLIDWCQFEANGNNGDEDGTDTFEAVEDWAQDDCAYCPYFAPPIDDSVYMRYSFVDKDGVYNYQQVIKVIDEDEPVIDAPTSISVLTSGGATTKDEVPNCSGSEIITAIAEDFCDATLSGSDGLSWTIIITNEQDEILAQETAQGPTASISSQDGGPEDHYSIQWSVRDGCGNIGSATTEVSFQDTIAPTPLCIALISTNFDNVTGTVTIWAKDYLTGSFDNCCSEESLQYSIVQSGTTALRPGEEGFEEQGSITFNCRNIANFDLLDVYLWDCAGNGTSCTAAVHLDGDCPGDDSGTGTSALISGMIYNEVGDMINQVEVSIDAMMPEYPNAMMTEDDGVYTFSENPMTQDYRISAQKTDNLLNGISTLDLVLMQKHIIGILPLDSPYKVIAADINNDQRISVVDIITLRNVLLGLNNDFPNNQSWRFVDANFEFENALEPWPFKEEINILNLFDHRQNEDFIGVKIGDLNGSSSPNQGRPIENRTNEIIDLTTDHQYVRQNEIVSIQLNSQEFDNIYGFQFTMQHEGLELIDLDGNLPGLSILNTGTISYNQTAISWSSQNPVSTKEVIALKFQATKNVDLKDVLTLDSEFLTAEIYQGESHQIHGIQLIFNKNKNEVDQFMIQQNEPNPFKETTRIRFDIPDQGVVHLKIIDINGRIISSKKQYFDKGSQQFLISTDDLFYSGIYYYQLSYKGSIQQKKMMLLK